MTVTMLNSGMYDVSEAALLLGRSTDELIRWASSGPDGGPAMVPATFQRAFSFADLVSLRVIVSLREAGIQEKDLRRGIAELRDYFVTDRPLARADILSRLATSGDSFLAELDGELIDIGRRRQGVFQDIVRVYVRRIQFGASGDPEVNRPGFCIRSSITLEGSCDASKEGIHV